MSSKGKLFYCEISKGYIIKVIVDSLTGPLQRGYFIIDNNGIRLRQQDTGNTVLYDIDLPRKNLKGYVCKKPLVISVNLKHLQGQLKNVKKKDALILFINSSNGAQSIGKFSVSIRPDGSKKGTRTETNSIVYQEETNYVLEPLPPGGYSYPMVIDATDFQKIKRLTQIGKTINVIMQGDNYLSFKCDQGVVLDSELEFGEFQSRDTNKDICKTCGENIYDSCWCTCEKCNEYLCDCYCECSACGEYLVECSCENEGNKVTDIFTADYYSNILSKLVKLPGLCTQMQFYAPHVEGYPLKIEANAGQTNYTLGTIQVYVKDAFQIAHEESLKNEEESMAAVKPKGKGKKK